MFPKEQMPPSFITLDLEDLCFDLLHNLGLNGSPNMDKLLWKSLENLHLLIERCNSQTITIFSTGILAKQHPKIIRYLSDLGHELALHNYFHEDVSKMTPKNSKPPETPKMSKTPKFVS